MYVALKYSHIVLVTISIVLFQYRFLLTRLNRPLWNPLKIIPHLNDTLLLITGISLATIAGFNPLVHSWLLAKIIFLFLYIGFGMLALKSDGFISIVSYLSATLTIVFMVFTALNKTPFIFGT